MPTRAKSQKPSAQEGAAEAKSNSSNENNSNSDTIPHCKTTEDSCKCNNQENCSEWVIDSEELLHVEINGIFQDILPSHNSKNLPTQSSDDVVRFLGLDTSEPIAQIGGTEEGSSAAFFSGHYENTVGTSTFFSVEDSYLEENGSKSDPVFFEDSGIPASKRARYICKADKKLVLNRVFLNKKADLVAENDKTEESNALNRHLTEQKITKCNVSGPKPAPSDIQNK